MAMNMSINTINNFYISELNYIKNYENENNCNKIKSNDILYSKNYNFTEISNGILDIIDKFILIIDMPNFGGGTTFFMDTITSYYKKTSNIVIARNFNNMLNLYINNEYVLKTRYNVDESILFIEKYKNKINKILFNHTIGHHKCFINKLFTINKHTTYITHDFYVLCDKPQSYYYEIDKLYKTKSHYLDINLFDNVITQNEANINIFNKYYKKPIQIIELPDFKKSDKLIKTNNSQIVIGLIGFISIEKGKDILEKIINFYKNKDIIFVVFGQVNIYNFKNNRPYKNIEELNKLLIEYKPNMLLELSLWPETYSYTLSLCMLTQLPIIYLEKQFTGVIDNRLQSYNKKYSFKNYKDLYGLFTSCKQDFLYTIEETLHFDPKWSSYFDTNVNLNKKYYTKSDEELVNNTCIVPDCNVFDKYCIKHCGKIDLTSEPPILEFE